MPLLLIEPVRFSRVACGTGCRCNQLLMSTHCPVKLEPLEVKRFPIETLVGMPKTGAPSPHDVTILLARWSGGDKAALDELVPLVYSELRRLAASYLRRRSGQRPLEATSLVHEAYVQLADQTSISFENRAQFFGLAAKLMRDILVDHARRRHAAKRGGNQLMLSLGEAERVGTKPEVDLLLLDLALQRLAETQADYSRVVELRFFGGLTIEETAEAMKLSHATVERYWNFARAWLRRELDA